jgi:phospholipid/cholesterol/gamma-HCH transport system substrate-binding protein
MNERFRNIAVGLTAVVGLAVLATMVVIFAGLPEMFRTGYVVTMHFSDTHGLQAGDNVHMLGRKVGTITSVDYTDGNPLKGVTMEARIDEDVRVPTNVSVRVFSKGLVGKGYLALVPQGPLATDPETGQTREFYVPGQPIVLQGQADQGGSLLPKELTDKLESLGDLAEALKELIEPTPPADGETPDGETPDGQAEAAEPPAGLKGTVARMNRTLDAIYKITGDEANQKNLKDTLENLASVSETSGELVRKLITDAEDISKLVRSLQETVGKVNEGDGTMSKLLNDPQLYRSLLNLTEQLESMSDEARQLLKKWREEGMKINM